MISLTPIQKTMVRYVISVNMCIIFGFFTAGIINISARHFFGYVLLPIFVISAAIGLAVTTIYASLFGQMSFNLWAILTGWLAGAVSALLLGHVEVVPYSIALSLVFAAAVTTILTFLIEPKPFVGLDRLLMTIHVISIFLVVWAIIYSLWTHWLRPLGLIFAIDTFALWNTALVGGCPLTFLESRIRAGQGQQTELGQDGFLRYYLKRWFRIEIDPKTSRNVPRVIAVILFSWWIIDYLIH
jgi:hypothetical protein